MGSNIGVLIGVLVVLLFVGAVVLMMIMEWSKPGPLAQAGEEPVRAARTTAKNKAVQASKRKAPKKAAPAPKKKPAKKSKKK